MAYLSKILLNMMFKRLLDENEIKKQEFFLLMKMKDQEDTTIEKLSKLKPVFSKNGTVTAEFSQTSDVAAFVR